MTPRAPIWGAVPVAGAGWDVVRWPAVLNGPLCRTDIERGRAVRPKRRQEKEITLAEPLKRCWHCRLRHEGELVFKPRMKGIIRCLTCLASCAQTLTLGRSGSALPMDWHEPRRTSVVAREKEGFHGS